MQKYKSILTHSLNSKSILNINPPNHPKSAGKSKISNRFDTK